MFHIDRLDLRKLIDFNTRVKSAHYDEADRIWTITTEADKATTCRYFLPATGPLSVGRPLPFAGLKQFKGEYYQASQWPKDKVDFRGKRVAIVGTGATGVQIVPKVAAVAEHLTVFQRTPNYVLPGRNYHFDEDQLAEVRTNLDTKWDAAAKHPFGLAMVATGKNASDIKDPDDLRQILDSGWEEGGFHFQFETFDDLFTDAKSNEIASEYIRRKIRAVVKDPVAAEILCPKYPFLSKRPPCGHYYYETYNRPNVKLVDISKDEIDVYENGIKTQSGGEYEFDMIIFALGFDAATGALTQMDVRGNENKSLKETWERRLETYAGVFVPGFPNMFMICGPHVPFGNMPVVEEIEVAWIGRAIEYMEQSGLSAIDLPESMADAWSVHVNEVFHATLFPEHAQSVHAWFVGANVPGKPNNVLFYFGGVPVWSEWLEKLNKSDFAGVSFYRATKAEVEAMEEDPSIVAHRTAPAEVMTQG